MRNKIKYIWGILIFIVIAAIASEFMSFVLSKAKILPFNQTPYLYLTKATGGMDWKTENSPWGAWHKKNYTDHHKKNCFDVQYKSNEVGARDDPFTTHMPYKKSYVLLGDSFAEGYGVSKANTSEQLIENKLGINVLNFGASGNLGAVQYFLLYDKLASQYPHEGVIIYFFPYNDFNDNDYESWRTNGTDRFANQTVRYRPYYKKISQGEYTYFYPDNARPTDYFDATPFGFRAFVMNNFWTANVIRTARAVLSNMRLKKAVGTSNLYSSVGYFDVPREEQEASIYFVNKLVERIGKKPILLVIIPTEDDFSRIANGSKPETEYWYQQLRQLEEKHGNMKIIDLAKFPVPNIKDLYFSCDMHWSPFGNQWAAKIVSNHVSK